MSDLPGLVLNESFRSSVVLNESFKTSGVRGEA
jgi:hypothetical protein